VTRKVDKEKRAIFNAMADTTDVINIAFVTDEDHCVVPKMWRPFQTVTFIYEGDRTRNVVLSQGGIRIETEDGQVWAFIAWRCVFGIFPHNTDEGHYFWPKDAPGGSLRGLDLAKQADAQKYPGKLRELAQKVRPRKKRDSGVFMTPLRKRAKARWGSFKVYE
jgi:hypothetical protein